MFGGDFLVISPKQRDRLLRMRDKARMRAVSTDPNDLMVCLSVDTAVDVIIKQAILND